MIRTVTPRKVRVGSLGSPIRTGGGLAAVSPDFLNKVSHGVPLGQFNISNSEILILFKPASYIIILMIGNSCWARLQVPNNFGVTFDGGTHKTPSVSQCAIPILLGARYSLYTRQRYPHTGICWTTYLSHCCR